MPAMRHERPRLARTVRRFGNQAEHHEGIARAGAGAGQQIEQPGHFARACPAQPACPARPACSASRRNMDAQVGRVLDALQELGLEDDTIVVFASDHGFMLGEHGQWMKNILWDPAARVPLILRVPGRGASAGKRSPRTVELLDIYPTLVELAGLPEYSRNEGKSLTSLLAKPTDGKWTKPALSQVRGGRSIRTERWRYTEWEEGKKGRELYDHRSDPAEEHNLADSPRFARTVTSLRALLPRGPVEPRPNPVRYDAIRDCTYFPVAKANPDQKSGGGDGAAGLKRCEELDP